MKKVVLILMVLGLFGCEKVDNDKAIEQRAKLALNEANNIVESEKTANKSEHKNNWEVIVNKDEMLNKEKKWLSIVSENSANLSFPYEGENYLRLDILDSKDSNPRIFVRINKGQYDCGLNGCYSLVKFGNNPAQQLDFNKHDTPGGDGTILSFSGNSVAFLKNVRKFNTIIIELPFYRDGTRQFLFKTAGFNEAEKNI